MKLFQVVTTNPNETTGGGGCACGVRKPTMQQGPFIVFPATDMEDAMSPHNVVCCRCAAEALGQDALAGSEAPPEAPEEEHADTPEEVVHGEFVEDEGDEALGEEPVPPAAPPVLQHPALPKV